ncbi:MAG: RNA polymerase sigma factor [Limisphaerales bacterium]
MAGRGQIEEIYQEHSGALWVFLLNVLRDDDLAREAIQEVFAKITVRPSLLAEARNERAYLLRLAHNQAVDLIRKDAAVDRKKKVVQASASSPFAPAGFVKAAVFIPILSSHARPSFFPKSPRIWPTAKSVVLPFRQRKISPLFGRAQPDRRRWTAAAKTGLGLAVRTEGVAISFALLALIAVRLESIS